MTKQYIFISGAPRSGTSALTSTLNVTKNTKLGMEFFPASVRSNDRIPLTQDSFEPEALRQVLSAKFSGEVLEKHLEEFAKSPIIGDKHPQHHRNFDHLDNMFPGCHHVFIFRTLPDVAKSFQQRFENPDDHWNLPSSAAVEHWCRAAKNVLVQKAKNPENCVILNFRTLYAVGTAQGERNIRAFYRHLSRSLDLGPPNEQRLRALLSRSSIKQAENQWSDADERDLTSITALFDAYAEATPRPVWDIDTYLKLINGLRAHEWQPEAD